MSLMLVCIIGANVDATLRSFTLLAKQRDRTAGGGTRCCETTFEMFHILFLAMSFLSAFLVVCNAARMVMTPCTYINELKLNEENAETTDEFNMAGNIYASPAEHLENLQAGIELQFKSLTGTGIAYPVSWLLYLIAFFFLVGCYDPPEEEAPNSGERRSYEGLNTEEL